MLVASHIPQRTMYALWTLLPSVGMGLFAHLSAAAYTLQDDYNNTSSFFDMFDFYTVCTLTTVRKSLC